jgi:hypothetical protein
VTLQEQPEGLLYLTILNFVVGTTPGLLLGGVKKTRYKNERRLLVNHLA